ncbi:MAG: hypothetical protein JXR56_01835, partial [Candidatus Cloacimonetes bacterium]|nr:hypothetical protein [Candidatus Cloacimonadota bacterium]
MRDVTLVTGNGGFFGQGRKPWDPLDIKSIITYLKQYNISITHRFYHQIINGELPSPEIPIIYSFSQRPEIRAYLIDMANYLDFLGFRIIPSLEILLCHENKGFQELLKKRYAIDSLKAFYFSDFEDIDSYNLQYPVVLKKLDGSNGKGVFLIEDENTLTKTVSSFARPFTTTQKLDLLRRKHFRKSKSYKEYPNYSNTIDLQQYSKHIMMHKRFVIQEFIPGLDHDYRVLKAGDRFYITKRHTKDTFKASGTKLFDFEIPNPEPILRFAKSVTDKIDSPFLSMDICHRNDNFYLLEFQGLHFGMNVVVKGTGYFVYQDNTFKFQTQ